MTRDRPCDGPLPLFLAPADRQPGRRSDGFTLIELMTALSIVAILSMIAAPSFEGMMVRSVIRSVSSDLGSDLNLARNEAIRTGNRVTLCPRQDDTTCGTDWNNGWLVFRDQSGALGVRDGTDIVIQAHQAITSPVTLARTDATGAISYFPGGSAANGSLVALEIRHPHTKGRNLTLSAIGRLTTTVEP